MIYGLTGLTPEAALLRTAPGVVVLCGSAAAANLRALVPSACRGLISFGVCGGLVSEVSVGDLLLVSRVVTGVGSFFADAGWAGRLFSPRMRPAMLYSGVAEVAATPQERYQLAVRTGTVAVDQETWAVAQVAADMKIPWVGVRSPSDVYDETVVEPPGAVNPDGSDDAPAVLMDLLGNLDHLPSYVREDGDLKTALAALTTMIPTIAASWPPQQENLT